MPKKRFIAVNVCGTKEVPKSISSSSALKHWKKNSKLTLKASRRREIIMYRVGN